MLRLCILALLVHTTFAVDPHCKGEEIHSRFITKDDDIFGNWTYVYYWNNIVNLTEYMPEFLDGSSDRELKCSVKIEIWPVDDKYVKEKQEKCGNKPVPVNWEDAKLKVTAPSVNVTDAIVFMGEKENLFTTDCQKFIRIEYKKVSKDVMVVIIPEVAQMTALTSRRPLRLNEVQCLAHNLDVGKGLYGTGLCQ